MNSGIQQNTNGLVTVSGISNTIFQKVRMSAFAHAIISIPSNYQLIPNQVRLCTHTHTIAIYVRNEDQVWNSPTLGRHSIYKPDFFTVRFTLLSSTQLLADVMQTAITLHLRRPNS